MISFKMDKPIRVLLVEDDDDSAMAMSTVMERRGIGVKRASDAAAALRELDATVYDAMVTDIRLPEMSGVELLERIRRTESDFPVIFVTAYDSLETAIQAVRLGAQDYILKPFNNIDDLLVPLKTAIRNHRNLLLNRAFEEERKRILENSVDMLFMLDLTGQTVQYVSHSVETILGRSAAELVAASISDFAGIIHPDDRPGVLDLLQAPPPPGVQTGASGIECRMLHKDGSHRWFSWRHSVVHDHRGAAVALVGNARDITESVAARDRERKIQTRQRRDERVGSLAVLAGGIAHDINNKLMTVRGTPDLVEMYLRDAPGGDYAEKIRQCMNDSRANIEKIIHTVRELMVLSRSETQDLERLNLNHEICSYIGSPELSSIASRYRNVSIETSLAPGIPFINGARQLLQRVIMNLILNACQAMPRGGRLTISTFPERVKDDRFGYQVIRAGEYVVARFSDSGIGIPTGNIDRIFEPFFSTREKNATCGSGLGLAVVHGIMKQHRGLIDVWSEVGMGTEFSLYFPMADCGEQKPDESRIFAMDVSGKERVLVVDESQEQRELAEKMLGRLGYSVLTADSGEGAVRLLRSAADRGDKGRSPVDLVMLDAGLGNNLAILGILREVLKAQPDQKIIIVGAFGGDYREKEAAKMGVAAFVGKPYTIEGLGRAVRKALDQQ